MSKSIEDLNSIIANDYEFENLLKNLVKKSSSSALSGSAALKEPLMFKNEQEIKEEGTLDPAIIQEFIGDEELAEIPKSYDEIYKLSNRNRKKNKDKKRGRNGEGGGNDSSMDTETFLLEKNSSQLAHDMMAMDEENEVNDGNNEQEITSDGFNVDEYFKDTVPREIDNSVDGTVRLLSL
jgi:hypothetical protein